MKKEGQKHLPNSKIFYPFLLFSLFFWKKTSNQESQDSTIPILSTSPPQIKLKAWQSKKTLPLESELELINYKLEHLYDPEKQLTAPASPDSSQKKEDKIQKELTAITTKIINLNQESLKPKNSTKQKKVTPIPTAPCTLPHHNEEPIKKVSNSEPTKDPLVQELTAAIEDLHSKWHQVAGERLIPKAPALSEPKLEMDTKEYHYQLTTRHLIERAFLRQEDKRIQKTMSKMEKEQKVPSPERLIAEQLARQQVLRIAAKLEGKRPIPKSELDQIEETLQRLKQEE